MKWKLLAGVPEEDVQRLLAIARRRKFARGEVVFHHHDPADTLHLIDKGRFAVRVTTPLGDTAILTLLGPGEMFGELALLGEGDARRSATVAALEPAETRCVHRLDFDRLRAEHPETSQVLIAILAGQVRRLSGHLLDALYVPADKRVRRRLAEVSALYDGDGDDGAVVPLTQDDIAGLAGTSRATVNRVLREEAARGVVELRRGRTRVLDPEALARRAR
jgi:CRP/FNR family transcriptional regulator, cyclic AMP receptor protein